MSIRSLVHSALLIDDGQPSAREIAGALGRPMKDVAPVLRDMERDGEIVRLDTDAVGRYVLAPGAKRGGGATHMPPRATTAVAQSVPTQGGTDLPVATVPVGAAPKAMPVRRPPPAKRAARPDPPRDRITISRDLLLAAAGALLDKRADVRVAMCDALIAEAS